MRFIFNAVSWPVHQVFIPLHVTKYFFRPPFNYFVKNNKMKKQIAFLVRLFILLIPCLLFETDVLAHHGSGIVVDKEGNVFFTDTGQGSWEIDNKVQLSYIPASLYH